MHCEGKMKTFKTADRAEWRRYLEEHFESDSEVWFLFPVKSSGKESISYNDAVEEALCFGWIDSTNRRYDDDYRARRFTPRREGSPYSQPNIERLKALDAAGLIRPEIREKVSDIIEAPFVFPDDIIAKLKQDAKVWDNYQAFSDSYKRLRIAYIEAARNRPDEFEKRLVNFIEKTREGKLIRGYGGVEKYYC